ncbi:MAG: aspartate-semialdehyde dehydrogenase [Bacteroides sp.]|nr:MAG: aspartate-semialdehyde dehydrogenase [Bacteroides sp.]
MKLAIIGITGLVGLKIKEILEKSQLYIDTIIPVASKKNVGKQVLFRKKYYKIINCDNILDYHPDIVLLSAGAEISKKIVPILIQNNITVIDNSSAWRMNKNVKLIVPEINANILTKKDKIISNPNCTTIQLLMGIHNLHKIFKIKRLVLSTYQSITGTGKNAIKQLYNERNNIVMSNKEMAYQYKIDMNIIPQIDIFLNNGYTKEEIKIINETKKIMNDDEIKITATAVRVPVIGGHSISVNIQFDKSFKLHDIFSIIKNTDGVILKDDINNNIYPMPIDVHEKDEVYIGRIRIDESCKNSLNMWIVADNLRKGAATNALQILDYLIKNKILSK